MAVVDGAIDGVVAAKRTTARAISIAGTSQRFMRRASRRHSAFRARRERRWIGTGESGMRWRRPGFPAHRSWTLPSYTSIREPMMSVRMARHAEVFGGIGGDVRSGDARSLAPTGHAGSIVRAKVDRREEIGRLLDLERALQSSLGLRMDLSCASQTPKSAVSGGCQRFINRLNKPNSLWRAGDSVLSCL